ISADQHFTVGYFQSKYAASIRRLRRDGPYRIAGHPIHFHHKWEPGATTQCIGERKSVERDVAGASSRDIDAILVIGPCPGEFKESGAGLQEAGAARAAVGGHKGSAPAYPGAVD